jgi:hypothetical protein
MRPEKEFSGRYVRAGDGTRAFQHRWEHSGAMPAETIANAKTVLIVVI